MAGTDSAGAEEALLQADSDVEKGREAFKQSRKTRATLSLGQLSTCSDESAGTAEELAQKYGSVRFKWNNRLCYGKQFHVDILNDEDEDVVHQDVMNHLNQGVSLEDRFAYTTKFQGKVQICTGLAIHLAASRGYTHLVETLLDRNASVESMTFRDDKEHYDVIHAAVFKEGRGGWNDIISTLCARGANIDSENRNGHNCLHLAFQTGNMKTINAVRHARRLKGLDDADENCEQEMDFDAKNRKATPLELGIQFAKMNKEDLAKAAPPQISSLKVFIHHAPECIPFFMDRLMKESRRAKSSHEEKLSKMLADKLSHKDIARLLRETPEAAVALLNAVTAKPVVTSEGWHPLPSRVSFAPRSWVMRFLKWIVPNRRFLCFYEADYEWRFDDISYESPPWHDLLLEVKDPPRIDASIQVCYIPNIISANIFAALVSCTDGEDPALFLYESVAVRAAVSYTFWNGAIWVDVLQFLISFWGLALLVLETCFKHEAAVGQKLSYLDWEMNEGVFQPSFVAEDTRNGVVADWIIAKGMVDLLLEVAQFCGCVIIGEVPSYLNVGNAWDLTRSIIPILLLFFHDSRLLHLLIVLIYWMRLLEGVTYSEKIGHALLPLQKLATGLLPAMTFTLVGFCALTHAMYAVQVHAQHLWPNTLFKTFTTLITQGLPEEPPEDVLELMVLYGGVLFFSVFVLNIFIGVIGEQYTKEKDQVGLMFISVRASSCLTYLLRIIVFPCNLVDSTTAAIIASIFVFATLALQVLALFFGRQLPGLFQLFAFVACQLITFIATIQCKGSDFPWTERAWCFGDGSAGDASGAYAAVPGRPGDKKRYLWICEPRDLVPHNAANRGDKACSRALTRKPSGTMFFELPDAAAGSMEDLSKCDVLTQMIRQAVREGCQEYEIAKDFFDNSSSRTSTRRATGTTSPALPTLLQFRFQGTEPCKDRSDRSLPGK